MSNTTVPCLVRGGPEAQMPALADGEVVFTTDTHRLYVGEGGVRYLVGSADGGGGGGSGGSGGCACSPNFSAENKDSSTLAVGAVLATHSSGAGVVRATAADAGRVAVGLAVSGVAVGFAETVQAGGPFTLADWSAVAGTAALSARAVYYLDATAGMLTTTPPASVILQAVGRAISADTLELSFSQSLLL